MAKTTVSRPSPKKGATIHSNITQAQLAELRANRESFNQHFEDLGKRLDVVEDRLGIPSDDSPGDPAEAGKKPCGCASKNVTAYAEGLLWGAVIGVLITSIVFIRHASRQRHYFGE